ncbi:MAG TPA: xanthine dehydrogenase family protein molybdopterin-binding subunit [Candidatus Methylomirabilis sp.]|nr:xanthine dehydrogenase family protein molybdopterin-binding subunit [Candidatus Methylomirabilis sp.]
MSQSHIVNVSRRLFLQAGAGLTLATYLPSGLARMAEAAAGRTTPGAARFEPNAFVRIGADNTVTVIVKHLEMGQGTYTGLPTLVAEELDAAWAQIRVEGAPADAKRYNNLLWGPMQGTGGSTALANSFEQMRTAGAIARAMLVAAAAQRWKVAPESLRVQDGAVIHPASGRKASFGQLALQAARLPVPAKVTLKDPKDFVYIGKRVPRKDSADKITGRAVFTQDVRLRGMLTALVAHPPRFGAKVKSFDAAKAKLVPGVVDVVGIGSGVAVLAKDFWSAKMGREALAVVWDETGAFRLGSPEILARYKELARRPGAIARKDGDADQALGGAAKRLQAAFEFPFLAHAAMEPMNCVVKLGRDACEVWNGEQFQTADQAAVAATVGLKPEQVRLHMLYAGGSFGRRANPHSDYLVEAASIAKAIRGRAPVKLVWTREDDMQAGYYRPMYYHELAGGLDAEGRVVAWQHRIVGQSILAGTAFEGAMVKDGIDATSVEGAATLPYAIPNLTVDLHSPRLPVPVQWWRSVGSTHTAFSTETFLDELAGAAGKDPVDFRRSLLGKHPRHRAVLDLAAAKAGWGAPLAKGGGDERRGRGVAVHESFNTFVAQVAEVSVSPDGRFRVDRVVCAVDCGIAVNPDVIRAQMEGGIGFGLAAVLHSAITLKGGIVEQTNFDAYVPLRIDEMPAIEVHMVESQEKPTGVGEPGTPVIAPAVANALFAATGKRARRLPITPDMLV